MEQGRWMTRVAQILFAVMGIIGICVMVYIGRTFKLDHVRIVPDPIYRFDVGWHDAVTGEPVVEAAYLHATSGESPGTARITNTLPAYLDQGTMFCMRCNRQMVRLYLDGVLHDTYATENQTTFGSLFASVLWLSPLPTTAAGQTITLEITSPMKGSAVDLNEIILGDRSAIAFEVLKDNFPNIAFVCITTLLGLICFILSLWHIIRRKNRSYVSFLHLGLFMLLSAVWVLTDSLVLQLVINNTAMVDYLSFFVFTIMPVPLLLYADSVFEHCCPVMKILSLVNLALLCIIQVLYLTGVAELTATLPLIHAFYIVVAVLLFLVGIRQSIQYKNSAANGFIVGLSLLCVCSVASIILYNGNLMNWYELSFIVGMFSFETALCGGVVMRFVRLMNEQTEIEVYKHLAYTDVMTMLGNRAAFNDLLRQTHEASLDGRCASALVMMDMNNLKYWNDRFGHTLGDELLKDSAEMIRKAFSPSGKCFRIGGDEFAAILPCCTEEQVRDCLSELDRLMSEYQEKYQRSQVLAYGYAMSKTDDGETYPSDTDWFRAADSCMYAKKASYKHL